MRHVHGSIVTLAISCLLWLSCTTVLISGLGSQTVLLRDSTVSPYPPNTEVASSSIFRTAMDAINEQIEKQLGQRLDENHMDSVNHYSIEGPAPTLVPRPTDVNPMSALFPRFLEGGQNASSAGNGTNGNGATNASLNIQLLNSLDLASAQPAPADVVKKAYPRQNAVSFASIASETIQRAQSAYFWLKNYVISVGHQIKVRQHDLAAWVANQHSMATFRIKQEEDRIGRLSDELTHLQHVYEDAVSKDRSYQMQADQLVAERQLQKTPPIMPVVAEAALSDDQFNSAISKLKNYRELAAKIMQETTHGIQVRQHTIGQATEWVVESKKALNLWLGRQNTLIQQHISKAIEFLKLLKQRMMTLNNIFKQAKEYRQTYIAYVRRMDLSAHIKRLEEELKLYDVKAVDPYDTTKLSTFKGAVKLEIEALKKKVEALNAPAEISSPPPVWGVLADFHAAPTAAPTQLSADPNSPAWPYPTLKPMNPFTPLEETLKPRPYFASSIENPRDLAAADILAKSIEDEKKNEKNASNNDSAAARFRATYPGGGIAGGATSNRLVMPARLPSNTNGTPAPPIMPRFPPPPDSSLVGM